MLSLISSANECNRIRHMSSGIRAGGARSRVKARAGGYRFLSADCTGDEQRLRKKCPVDKNGLTVYIVYVQL